MPKFHGGCLCGGVRYQVESAPLAGFSCHCRDCQYLSGGAEANVVVVPQAAFSMNAGKCQIYRSTAASGADVWRSFCPICGTPLFAGSEIHPEVIAIKAGTLDDPSIFQRQAHIWVGSAPDWHLIDPGLPRAESNPDLPNASSL